MTGSGDNRRFLTRFHTSGTNWSSLYDGRHISPSYPTPLSQHDQPFPFLGRVIVYVEEFSACFFFARRFAFFDAALEAVIAQVGSQCAERGELLERVRAWLVQHIWWQESELRAAKQAAH